jgi:outer membrane murein-binding lipoprotein Lpp
VTTIVVGCASRKILRTILNEVRAMGARLDELTAKVTANSAVVDSAVELLNGLKERLDAAIASGDPAELEALSASLGADTAELAAAVAANTPAE